MSTSDEPLMQLATRIPRRLHRDVKIHCVGAGVTIAAFIEHALRERLTTSAGRRTRRPVRRAASA